MRKDKQTNERVVISITRNSTTQMSLFDFSDEIFQEIFDYLHLSEVIYSFYDFLRSHRRLKDVIENQLRQIYLSKIDLRFMTKSQFLFTCQLIKSQPKALDKIHHLTLSNEYTFGQIRLFLSQISFDQLIHLKQLTLIQPALDEYHTLFPTKLSRLTHLTLENPECDDDGRVIPIDDLNHLIQLNITSEHSVQFRSQYDHVENLTVSQYNLVDLMGFSTFFPNLHYLDITLVGTEIDFIQVQIPHLSVLKLRTYEVHHDLCEKFIGNFLQLKELYYSNDIDGGNTDLVDGYRCRTWIEPLTLLEKFELDISLYNMEETDICQLAGSYQTEFYLSKHWNIVCESPPNSHDYHIYSVPLPSASQLYTTSDSLVSASVFPVDNCYANVDYLGLDMTSNWPLAPRFYPNVQTIELSQTNATKIIPTVSILSFLNKSMFLINLRKLILPSPCHFDQGLLRHLLEQSAPNISNLDIPCNYLLGLIKSNILQPPLLIRVLTLRDDYLPIIDRDIFHKFFGDYLECLTLYLQNHTNITETIQLFLDQFRSLYSLDVLIHEPISMLIHVQLCQMIHQRPQAGAELRPMNIRIWQK